MQLFKQIALKPDFSGPIKSLNSIYSKLSNLRPFGSHGTNLSLFDLSPGKLSHARWFTTAYRILHLHISETSLSNNLLILVNCIAKVYIPMLLKIKNKTSITEPCKHFYKLMQRSRYL